MSTLTFLFIEDGSISICIFLELGEIYFKLPVILSSNLAPTHSITSQSCIAIFASYVPCIPNIPIKFLFFADTAPNPIKVCVIGIFR